MSHKMLSALVSVTAAAGILSLTAVVRQEREAHEGIRVNWSTEVESAPAAGRVEVVVATPSSLKPESAPAQPEVVVADVHDQAVRERTGPLDLYYVAECFGDVHTGIELDEARACVAERLGDDCPTSDQLAGWISGLPEGRLAEAEVLMAEVLTRLEPSEVLEYVRRLAHACPDVPGDSEYAGYSGNRGAADRKATQLILRSIAHGEGADVSWYEELAESLEPRALFRGGAETISLAVAHQFAEHGDAAARRLLEEGATGRHGGSKEELLRAATLGMTLQKDGTESIAFLSTILESGSVPGEIGFGRFMATELMEPDAWVAGEPRSAFRLLERILEDPRFRLGAAGALHASIDHAPAGVSPAMWEELRASEEGRAVWNQLAIIIPD